VEVARYADASLDEVSGLVVSRLNPGVLWVVEDSGADAELHAVDLQGGLLGTLALEDVDATDVEELALGPCGATDQAACLYVADVGDNDEERDTVQLHRLAEPLLPSSAPWTLSSAVTSVVLQYPDGAHNVEAMVVDGTGVVWLFSKRDDNTSRIFRVEPAFGSNDVVTAQARGSFTVGDDGLVTGAALWPGGSRLAVRTYFSAWEWDIPAGMDVGTLLEDRRFALALAVERQGEAITYDVVNNAYWHTSEGEHAPLHRAGCQVP